MKVIDLLNKIANGEDFKEKHIKYFDRIDQEYDICMIYEANIIYKLDEASIELNDEIEIIEDTPKEDKKIKRIQSCGDNLYSEYIGQWLVHKENYSEYDELLMNKLNEIIDYINEGEDK